MGLLQKEGLKRWGKQMKGKQVGKRGEAATKIKKKEYHQYKAIEPQCSLIGSQARFNHTTSTTKPLFYSSRDRRITHAAAKGKKGVGGCGVHGKARGSAVVGLLEKTRHLSYASLTSSRGERRTFQQTESIDNSPFFFWKSLFITRLTILPNTFLPHAVWCGPGLTFSKTVLKGGERQATNEWGRLGLDWNRKLSTHSLILVVRKLEIERS